MGFINLDLKKLWLPPGYRGLKWAGSVIKGNPPFEAAAIQLRFDIGRIHLTVFERTERDQGHAQVPHFFEQAMQCGLVNYRAGQKRVTVVFQRDGQAFKPVCPFVAQMALDPDLIDRRFIWIRVWVEFVSHTSVPFVAGHSSPCH
jgi:hypothetical protein